MTFSFASDGERLPHFKSHSTCVVTDHNRCKIAAKSTQDSTLIFVVLLKKMYHIHEGELDSHCLKAFCPCYKFWALMLQS